VTRSGPSDEQASFDFGAHPGADAVDAIDGAVDRQVAGRSARSSAGRAGRRSSGSVRRERVPSDLLDPATPARPARVVRVRPDIAGVDKLFDYLVPPELADDVRVGTLVRVELQRRRVGGWVVADDVEPPPDVELAPVLKVTGWGPPTELVELADWAAWRWAGRSVSLLRTASPDVAVRGIPRTPPVPAATVATAAGADVAELAADALARPVSVVRLPPAADPYPLVAAAAGRGPALVLVPSVRAARHLAARLRRALPAVAVVPRDWAAARAGGATVVGARGAAWAPLAAPSCVVVLDEHDEAFQQEQAPTWHARDVAIERARRAGVPCVLVSPTPTLEALAAGTLLTPSRTAERAGWPVVDVVDTRDLTGSAARYSPHLVEVLRSDAIVLCVLNRKGRSRLLACATCGEVATCERCEAAVVQEPDGQLACRRCGVTRPQVCLRCGGTGMKNLRAGVSRAREELEALALRPVVELSSDVEIGPQGPGAGVVVGTEAALHQLDRVDVVAFLDLDQELLAPRYRAAEQALALVARAARLVGGRDGSGRLLVQTRVPDHEVVRAAVLADPARVAAAESARRAALGYPPATAMAVLSGAGAAELARSVEAVGDPLVAVVGPADDRWLVRAPDHRHLCDALAAAPRPSARVRVEVDPLRI
jgi:primosomal protein N' (replication factor Y)